MRDINKYLGSNLDKLNAEWEHSYIQASICKNVLKAIPLKEIQDKEQIKTLQVYKDMISFEKDAQFFLNCISILEENKILKD